MKTLLAVLALLSAVASFAGESPDARAAREALEPYARAFGIRLIPLQMRKDDDFLSTNYAYQDEKEKLYQLRDCFRDGRDFDGPCKAGMYLTAPRFKAAYEEASKTDGRVDHAKGARWFCGLVSASRGYFHYYAATTYYGTPVASVDFIKSVVSAETALLKESYGVSLELDVRDSVPQCNEKLVEELKRVELIAKEVGPDEHHPREAAPAEPACADTVYRGVEDLRRLQGEGKRFVWFSGTLWGGWTKDLDTLALLLDCRGARWVGTFVGAVPRESAFTGGSVFHGCAVRHADQPRDYKSIDWAKVNAPERKRACRELSRRLKR